MISSAERASRQRRARPALAALLALLVLPSQAPARAGEDIVIGMSAPLSGGCQSVGEDMKRGIEAGLAEINGAGGIQGRPLRLLALDDEFEPTETDENMHALIDRQRVFAVMGNVGSPPAIVAAQWAEERRVPLVAAMSGTRTLRRQPPDRYVMNLRPGFMEETEAIVAGLVDQLGVPPARVGLLTPDDADGDAVRTGLARALRRRDYQQLGRNAHGDYPRCTLDVETAVSRIVDSATEPLAVVMLCTTEACARFVQLARRERLAALFVAMSMADGPRLAREGGRDAEGVVVTQVVPPPGGAAGPGPDLAIPPALGASSVALEGYVGTRLLAAGLRRAAAPLTRDSFIDALEAARDQDLGLGGLGLWRGHQAGNQIHSAVVNQGKLRAFSWRDLGRRLGSRAALLRPRPPGAPAP